MKIAIYSGEIPSTTFIENLIEGVSKPHEVVLFGKLKQLPDYSSGAIKIYPTHSNSLKAFVFTLARTLLLFFKYPKRFWVLKNHIESMPGWRTRFNWWARYVPVVLHLPDVFHLQWAKDLPNWIFLKDLFGCKFVLSLRGAHINYSPLVDDALAEAYRIHFPKVDRFHAVSHAIALEAQKYGAAASKIKVIHSIVPESTLQLFRLPPPIKHNTLHIISVGRHHWKKGYSTALDACYLLKQEGVAFKYTIVASGNIPEELVYKRKMYGLEREVVFEKGLAQNRLFKIMQASDVLLLPSLEEGIANVVLEAMALGVPVISSDCGGMCEVVKDQKSGYLIPVLNPIKIKDSILDLITSSLEDRQKLTKMAYTLVRKNNNETVVVKQFDHLYSFN